MSRPVRGYYLVYDEFVTRPCLRCCFRRGHCGFACLSGNEMLSTNKHTYCSLIFDDSIDDPSSVFFDSPF